MEALAGEVDEEEYEILGVTSTGAKANPNLNITENGTTAFSYSDGTTATLYLVVQKVVKEEEKEEEEEEDTVSIPAAILYLDEEAENGYTTGNDTIIEFDCLRKNPDHTGFKHQVTGKALYAGVMEALAGEVDEEEYEILGVTSTGAKANPNLNITENGTTAFSYSDGTTATLYLVVQKVTNKDEGNSEENNSGENNQTPDTTTPDEEKPGDNNSGENNQTPDTTTPDEEKPGDNNSGENNQTPDTTTPDKEKPGDNNIGDNTENESGSNTEVGDNTETRSDDRSDGSNSGTNTNINTNTSAMQNVTAPDGTALILPAAATNASGIMYGAVSLPGYATTVSGSAKTEGLPENVVETIAKLDSGDLSVINDVDLSGKTAVGETIALISETPTSASIYITPDALPNNGIVWILFYDKVKGNWSLIEAQVNSGTKTVDFTIPNSGTALVLK
jgi:hypothetical protein